MGMSKRTKKSRRHHGGGPRPDKTEKKRAEAFGRQDAYNELSTERKLASLPIGGAMKQRAKLEAKLEEERNPKPKRAAKKEEPKDLPEQGTEQ